MFFQRTRSEFHAFLPTARVQSVLRVAFHFARAESESEHTNITSKERFFALFSPQIFDFLQKIRASFPA
jgi:hypothetical protein